MFIITHTPDGAFLLASVLAGTMVAMACGARGDTIMDIAEDIVMATDMAITELMPMEQELVIMQGNDLLTEMYIQTETVA